MFGHTLIRIDSEVSEKHPLLAYALTYAANVGGRPNALVYTFKGLFGGYSGAFALLPYYEKLKEYSDIEHRDVWEYQLNLNQDETNQFIRHIWELLPIKFDYYFFSENCAYHLLTLFSVARPSQRDLLASFDYKAIPADTIREIIDADFVNKINYVPSVATIFQDQLKTLSAADQQLIKELANGNKSPDVLDEKSPELATKILDIAYDYSRYLAIAQAQSNAAPSYALLRKRSTYTIPTKQHTVVKPTVNPEDGHKTNRAYIQVGRREGRDYLEFAFRPAFHDLLDADGGYQNGSQINFLDIRARYYPDNQDSQLEELIAVDIISLSPREALFKSVSWSVNFGLTRKYFRDEDSQLAPFLAGGAGLTYAAKQHTKAFVTLNGNLEINHEFDHGYTLGIGPEVGLLFSYPKHRTLAKASQLYHRLGEHDRRINVSIEHRYDLTSQTALGIEVRRQREFGHYFSEVSAAFYWFF